MGVDNLSRGRNQPFYHVFVASEVVPSAPRCKLHSSLVWSKKPTLPSDVAEENIIAIEVGPALVAALFTRIDGAGKQFGNVELNRDGELRSFGRLLQSPENRNVYPDDETYALEWAQRRYDAKIAIDAVD